MDLEERFPFFSLSLFPVRFLFFLLSEREKESPVFFFLCFVPKPFFFFTTRGEEGRGTRERRSMPYQLEGEIGRSFNPIIIVIITIVRSMVEHSDSDLSSSHPRNSLSLCLSVPFFFPQTRERMGEKNGTIPYDGLIFFFIQLRSKRRRKKKDGRIFVIKREKTWKGRVEGSERIYPIPIPTIIRWVKERDPRIERRRIDGWDVLTRDVQSVSRGYLSPSLLHEPFIVGFVSNPSKGHVTSGV